MQYVVSIGLVVVAAAAALLWINRPRLVRIDARLPADFPGQGFSHGELEDLLVEHVDTSGNVDYARWHDSPGAVARLDTYLAAVARFSPDSAPERFPTASDALAYWIHAYNACVIRGVLAHWPISSVTDVRAPIEAVKGLGFFHRLRFVFGGEALSLLAVENRKIRKRHRDARIHFLLNCASGSCPVLRPELTDGDGLEERLASAAAEFVGDTRNVSVDHGARQVILSRIFKWYRKDFVNELARQGRPSRGGLIDYVASVAPASLRAELDGARDYTIVYRDYDWSLNTRD